MNKYQSNILRDSHIFHDKNETVFNIFFGMSHFCRCLGVLVAAHPMLTVLGLYYADAGNIGQVQAQYRQHTVHPISWCRLRLKI